MMAVVLMYHAKECQRHGDDDLAAVLWPAIDGCNMGVAASMA